MSSPKTIKGSGFEAIIDGYFEYNDHNPMVEIIIQSESGKVLICGYVSDISKTFDSIVKQLNIVSKREYLN